MAHAYLPDPCCYLCYVPHHIAYYDGQREAHIRRLLVARGEPPHFELYFDDVPFSADYDRVTMVWKVTKYSDILAIDRRGPAASNLPYWRDEVSNVPRANLRTAWHAGRSWWRHRHRHSAACLQSAMAAIQLSLLHTRTIRSGSDQSRTGAVLRVDSACILRPSAGARVL